MGNSGRNMHDFIRENVRHLCITGSILVTVIRLMQQESDPEVIAMMLQLIVAEDGLRQLLASVGVDQDEVNRVLEEVNREAAMIETLRAQ